jgi:MFS family permease
MFLKLMSNPTFPFYLVAIMCTSWTRDALFTWMYNFFADARGVPTLDPASIALIAGGVTVGGFCGGILCGFISDKCFAGQRTQPQLFFNGCLIASITVLYLLRDQHSAVLAVLVFIICVFLLGNYTLLSYVVPSDLPSETVGTAAGIMTAAGYLASGASGLILGQTVTGAGFFWGWAVTLLLATSLGIVAVVFAHLRSGMVVKADEESVKDPSVHSSIHRRTSSVYVTPGGFFYPVNVESEMRVQQINKMRNAGVTDELYRSGYDSDGFYLYPSGEDEVKGPSERMLWRLEKANLSKENSKFLASRAHDTTSYFGTRQKKEMLSPY